MNKKRWMLCIGITLVSLVAVVFTVSQIKHVNADKISIEKVRLEQGTVLSIEKLNYTFGNVQKNIVNDELNQKMIEYRVPVEIKNTGTKEMEVPLTDFVALYSNYKSGLYSVFVEQEQAMTELVVDGNEVKKGDLVFMVYIDKYIEGNDNFRLYFSNNAGDTIFRYEIGLEFNN
ncbi:hypothetical protein HB852_07745 [Listeria grandensis]|uniref:Uncharacterized protein n=1 Tax=Listeria grandensis TaxID=1494963 RepID=A0A7X0Y263_9LIST|nr:hypothetical protein [Listeria grandensis]MBC1474508.1 hypothetical protein [Listeria grandensis]MBC1935637.1 hypothetical protein [Listeria grandensis]MBC6315996.1 hypothetical protein [Listeria grandensis]